MGESDIRALVQELRGMKELMEEQFRQNREEHHKINSHLAKLNNKVAKHEAWKNKQEPTINRWKRCEEDRRSQIFNFVLTIISGIAVGAIMTILTTNYF